MKRNYLKEVLKVVLATLVLLLIMGIIPDFTFRYKQFNIFSDIIKDSDPISQDEPAVHEEIETNEKTEDIQPETLTTLTTKTECLQEDIKRDVQLIINCNEEGGSLSSFFDALAREADKRQVRIGVMGDSFIESDILTGDLRTLLQKKFGGNGPGYVPVTSPAAQYRKNIRHIFSGWTAQSMIHFKKADWTKFCIAGTYFIPKEDAFVSISLPKGETVKRATFFFINQKQTNINVSVNNQPSVVKKPVSADSLQFISLENDHLSSVSISVSNVEGFTAFGVYLDSPTGVYVDNFSVRGSSGSVLTTVDMNLSQQLSSRFPYDLLILEHGLNVITEDTARYKGYKKLMNSAVRHIRKCYPQTPLLLMSVGDRSSKTAAGFITHPGVEPLIAVQQQVARENGIAFWNTFQAMGGRNSMVNFVQHTPPMASKDYTHINFQGGEKIANELFKSFMVEVDGDVISK